MRRGALAAAAVAAIILPIGLVGCGPTSEPVASTPRVTVPTPTGPALTIDAFRVRADSACQMIYADVNAMGDAPTSGTGETLLWYQGVAAAWHGGLDAVDELLPPVHMQSAWGSVVENYRAITQAADDNVALAEANREASELINSDATAAQTRAGMANVELLRRLGLTGCTGGT